MQPALKTRLLGAFVIIALIVIVVPLFFSGNPSGGGSRNISLDIPPPPDQQLKTRTMSVMPQSSATTAVTTSTPPPGSGDLATVNIASRVPHAVNPGSEQTTQSTGENVAPAASAPASANDSSAGAASAASPASKPVQQPVTSKPATANPGRAANTRYQIDLGAYAHKSNAEQLVAKAGKLGYQAGVSAVSIDGKPAAKVEVGPFDSRASAEVARLKLHAALPRAPAKLESVPTNQHGNAPAKALPKDRAGGWAVQVVAYSTRAQADKLRDRLRKAGFDGYVDSVKSGGQTLWRVRVGPLAQRSEAVSALKHITSEFSQLNGVVVTVP